MLSPNWGIELSLTYGKWIKDATETESKMLCHFLKFFVFMNSSSLAGVTFPERQH